MKHNIALIGYGNWGKIIAKEISKNKYFNLKAIVSSHSFKKKFKIKIYNNLKTLINNEKIDCIYIAKDPYTNFETLNYFKSIKLPIIFEKPISVNSSQCKSIINTIKKNKIIAFVNLPNLFSDTFDKTKEYIKSNELKIKKIIFHEGNYDPNRNKINPILDWGIHPFTYFFSIFNENKIKNIKYKEIIKRNQGNQIVAKFDLILKNKLHIKIVTGNLFRKKTRTLKVILENGDVLINDFINHKITLNNIIIYKSKITPLDNLLLNFSYSINKKNNLIGLKHFDSSLESIKILEKYI